MRKTFAEALKFRRSVRIYDPEKPLDPEEVKQSIEEATLAPSSSNMQLWEFYHIVSREKLDKMIPICMDQNAAKTAEQMVVVVTRKDLFKKRAQANVEMLYDLFGTRDKKEMTSRQKGQIEYFEKLMPFLYFDLFGIVGLVKKMIVEVGGLFRPTYHEVRSGDMRTVAQKSVGLAAQTLMLSLAYKGIDTCPMEGLDTRMAKKLLGLPYGAEVNMVISCGYRKEEGIYGPRLRVPFEEVYNRI